MLAAKKYSWAGRYLADGRACLSLAAVAQPVKGTKTVPCHQWRHSLALHQTFRHPGTTLLCKKPLAPEFGWKGQAEDPYLGAHLSVLWPSQVLQPTLRSDCQVSWGPRQLLTRLLNHCTDVVRIGLYAWQMTDLTQLDCTSQVYLWVLNSGCRPKEEE